MPASRRWPPSQLSERHSSSAAASSRWQATTSGRRTPKDGGKDPWFIHAAGPLLAAGPWEDNSPLLPDGNLGTFTIITGDSSGVSADIHDRMPVWLQAGQIDDLMAASAEDAMALLLASETPAMEAYRMSRAVNTPRNNAEGLLEPVA